MKRPSLLVAIVMAVTVVIFACGPSNTNRKVCDRGSFADDAELCVDRTALGFGAEFGSGTFIGARPVEAVSLTNRGLRPLEISSVTFEGEPEFKVTSSWSDGAVGRAIPATTITGGKQGFVQVEFAPTQPRGYSGVVRVASNAGNLPALVIQLTGCGVLPDGGPSNCYACDPLAQNCTPQVDGRERSCYLSSAGATFCALVTGERKVGDSCSDPASCVRSASCVEARTPGAEARCQALCARDGGSCPNGAACQTLCGRDETLCGAVCARTTGDDPRNCGGCGVACSPTQSCRRFGDGGVGCVNECAPGKARCDGGPCIDVVTRPGLSAPIPSDRNHCGGCNVACAANQLCVDGACVSGSCAAPRIVCRGRCVDPRTDRLNCGGCDIGCAGACSNGACQPPSAYNVCAL
ncbi:MAG: hypothetical protein INH41_12755 [Myxococcaceae bacterium]|nr:hypothetical protein [Myxococcaceae bacterium]MCA3013257.1 hypothetical protein [Myxococcaceae bacterium]